MTSQNNPWLSIDLFFSKNLEVCPDSPTEEERTALSLLFSVWADALEEEGDAPGSSILRKCATYEWEPVNVHIRFNWRSMLPWGWFDSNGNGASASIQKALHARLPDSLFHVLVSEDLSEVWGGKYYSTRAKAYIALLEGARQLGAMPS